jgi:hypothetical protein
MSTGRLRPVALLAAVLAGAALPLLSAGAVHADPPVPVPVPPIPSVPVPPVPSLPVPLPPLPPLSGQPITLVVQPPSLAAVSVPVAPTSCQMDISYDNRSIPTGILFRGQDACGSGIYAPTMSGQVTLTDVFHTVLATGNPFSAVGTGPFTSQGFFAVSGNLLGAGINAVGPVPGLTYNITLDTSITLVWPQTWDYAPDGCSLNGQTLHCIGTMTFEYMPGTQGGVTPS